MHLFIHCLLEAWHADAREFKRGTFRTSQNKLSEQTGIGRTKLTQLLKDLSTGDNPEIVIGTNKGYLVGYSEITILNYDKYQSNVRETTSNVRNTTSNVRHTASNVHDTASNVRHTDTKEEEEKNREKEEKKEERVLISSSTDVGSSFEELIEVYPKVSSHKVETLALFNNLDLDEKKKCVTFAKQLQRIWKQNAVQDKYAYMKSCHTFVENKLFNGKPSDVLPAGISTEVVDQPTKEQLEWLEKNKNKFESPIERFQRLQLEKETI
jgi:hypothetical protein